MEPASPDSAPRQRPPRLTARSLASASECPRRAWLNEHARAQAAPPAAHSLMLRERSSAHKRTIAERFPDRVGPLWTREGSFTEVAVECARLLSETRQTLYQPALLSPDGQCSAVPDLLYWDGDGLVVLDAKLALRPETRPDFALLLAHYRALLLARSGIEPVRYEIVNGRGETIEARPAPRQAYEAALRLARDTLALADEPDLLLAHSTCKTCAFYGHCWTRAEREGRIEILPEVQARHVPEYHALGVRTIAQLAELDEHRLPRGPVRGAAKRAIQTAAAWRDQRAVWLQAPRLPAGPLVWFDLEGDSRGEEAATPIYLWGLALEHDGGEPVLETLIAPFTKGGDREAWERFVARAGAILDAHPGVRWVHWDVYETLWIRRYAERCGAPEGFEARLLAACFDLKRVLDRSVRLPLRSYSIKHVAPWMGFRWRNPDSSSEWSVAHFEHAGSTTDMAERARLLAELAEYNADDLWAMRAVWRWLAAHAPSRFGRPLSVPPPEA